MSAIKGATSFPLIAIAGNHGLKVLSEVKLNGKITLLLRERWDLLDASYNLPLKTKLNTTFIFFCDEDN